MPKCGSIKYEDMILWHVQATHPVWCRIFLLCVPVNFEFSASHHISSEFLHLVIYLLLHIEGLTVSTSVFSITTSLWCVHVSYISPLVFSSTPTFLCHRSYEAIHNIYWKGIFALASIELRFISRPGINKRAFKYYLCHFGGLFEPSLSLVSHL